MTTAAFRALATMGAVTRDTASKAVEVLTAAHQAGRNSPVVWGLNPKSTPEHSSGRALDFMVYEDKASGDWIANYLWNNRVRLRVKWIIWQQQIRSTTPGKPTTWQPMNDRGNDTANHMDHVHVFFDQGNYVAPATGGAGSQPTRHVSLSAVQQAARLDGPRPQGGTTPGAADDVRIVEDALVRAKLLPAKWASDGSFGDQTRKAYSAWQIKSTGAVGNGADGIPGRESLVKLGRLYGFEVVA